MFDKIVKAVSGPVLEQVGFQQNRREAKRVWNRSMRASNTAYQRAMADMKAAGLNPILVGKFGGASTPGGMGAKMDLAGSATTGMQMAKLDSETAKINSEIEKIEQEVSNLEVAERLTEAQIKQVSEMIFQIRATAANQASQATGKNYQNRVQAILTDFYTKNDMVAIAKDMGLDAKTLVSILNTLLGAGALKSAAGALINKFGKKGFNADKMIKEYFK